MKRQPSSNQLGILTNKEIEGAVVGAVLVDPTLYPSVAAVLDAKRFGHVVYQTLWAAMTALHADGVPINRQTLRHKLEPDGTWAAYNLEHEVSQCQQDHAGLHAAVYAGLVNVDAARRDLATVGDQVKAMAFDRETGVGDSIQTLQTRLMRIQARLSSPADDDAAPRPIHQVVSSYLQSLEAGDDATDGREVSTGVGALDDLLDGGLRRNTTVVVGGEPGAGKTAFLLQTAVETAKAGQTAFFVALEMTDEMLVKRLIAAESGVPYAQLNRFESLTPAEADRVIAAAGRVAAYRENIILYSPSQITPSALWRHLRAINAQNPVRTVVVDYIQIMDVEAERRGTYRSDYERVSYFATAFRKMRDDTAAGIDATWVYGSQVKQMVDRYDKRPLLRDHAHSSEISNNANVVLMLYREKVYNAALDIDPAEVIVRKNREGRTGTAHCTYHGESLRFVDGVPQAARKAG